MLHSSLIFTAFTHPQSRNRYTLITNDTPLHRATYSSSNARYISQQGMWPMSYPRMNQAMIAINYSRFIEIPPILLWMQAATSHKDESWRLYAEDLTPEWVHWTLHEYRVEYRRRSNKAAGHLIKIFIMQAELGSLSKDNSDCTKCGTSRACSCLVAAYRWSWTQVWHDYVEPAWKNMNESPFARQNFRF